MLSFGENLCRQLLFLSLLLVFSASVELMAQSEEKYGSITLTELWDLGKGNRQDILFGDIQSVHLDSQGQLYVYDHDWAGKGIIYKISATGSLIRQIGSEGNGPGEFQYMAGIYVGTGDTVYAMDSRLERLYKYAPYSHEFFDMRRIQKVDELFSGPWRLIGVNPEGFAVGYMTPFMNWVPETMTSENTYDVYLINQEGIRSESEIVQEPDIERIIYEGGTGYTHMIFSPEPIIAMGKDGKIYAGNSGENRIRVLTADGNLERTLSWDTEAIPVTPEDIEKALEDASERRRNLTYATEIPENKPYYQHFLVDDKDHVWVQLNTRYGETGAEWLIIDGNSEIVNNFMLPINIRLLSVNKGKAYGVEDDVVLIAYSTE